MPHQFILIHTPSFIALRVLRFQGQPGTVELEIAASEVIAATIVITTAIIVIFVVVFDSIC